MLLPSPTRPRGRWTNRFKGGETVAQPSESRKGEEETQDNPALILFGITMSRREIPASVPKFCGYTCHQESRVPIFLVVSILWRPQRPENFSASLADGGEHPPVPLSCPQPLGTLLQPGLDCAHREDRPILLLFFCSPLLCLEERGEDSSVLPPLLRCTLSDQ